MGIDGVCRDWFVISSQHYPSTEVNLAVPLDVFSAKPLPINKQSFLLDQAQKIVEEWKRNTPDQKIELLSAVLKKVTIGRETVVLVYTRKGLLNILGVDDVTDLGEPDEVIVKRDAKFQRCGIESKIIFRALQQELPIHVLFRRYKKRCT